MLRPARWPYSGETSPGFTSYVTDWSKPAHYFKDWIPFNLQAIGGANTDTTTFGAFTAAPDGTTDTARLLLDTTANSPHALLAGWSNVNTVHYGKIRLAGIFKYAGRRIVLSITSAPAGEAGAGTYGCKAIFDLLNGRVAVASAAFGTATVPWVIYPAQITYIGDGWHLCTIEAKANTSVVGSPNTALYGKLSLDNGVGAAAESSSYAGDGTSGVYAWRSNMLPSRAWNLTTQAFFDDFDDASTIDLTNSRAPGFKWYINNRFPSYDGNGNVPTNPANLSVAGSVLTCASHPLPLFLSSAASTWTQPSDWNWPTPPAEPNRAYTQGYVGRGFVGNQLREYRAKWDITDSTQNDATAGWGTGLEWLVAGRYQDPEGLIPSREIDDFEALFGASPRIHIINYVAGDETFAANEVASGRCTIGVPRWYAEHLFGAGTHCIDAGVRYTALENTIGDVPASSPTKWGAYAQTDQLGAVRPVDDTENFHDYATLQLMYDPVTGEPGQIVQFQDGAMTSFPCIYGPGLAIAVLHQSDYQQMPVFLGCGPTMGISVDFVRVMQ